MACVACVENPAAVALYFWGTSWGAKFEGFNDIDQLNSTCSQFMLASPPERDE